MNTTISKANPVILLIYLTAPVVAGIIAAIVLVNPNGPHTFDSRLVMVVFIAMIGYMVIFLAIAPLIFYSGKGRLISACKENNCIHDYYFRGISSLLAIDTENRKLGILFKMNPFTPYVVNLDEACDAKTHNGCSVLSLGGTREVSFSFFLCGKKVKVPTLRANVTYSMKSREVLEAIAKADRMVAAINGTEAASN